MVRLTTYTVVVLLIADAAFARNDSRSSGEVVTIKKKRDKKYKSTSSESGAIYSGDKSSFNADSLEMDSSSVSSDTEANSKKRSKNKKHIPPDSVERPGWRKWHRKCKPCPEDAKKKWRDPSILWICGAYQRARRSFKSKCMMTYRNCQDGTMFIKLRNGKCANETQKLEYYHGDHFFYEYRVALSDDTSNSKKSSTTEEESNDDTGSYVL